MKILFLSDGISPYVAGGMQRHTFFVVKWLVKQGVEVMLYHCVDRTDYLVTTQDVIDKMNLSFSEAKFLKTECFYFPNSGKFVGHYIRRSKKYSRLLFEHWSKDKKEYDFVYSKGFCAFEFLRKRKSGLILPKVGTKLHGLNMFQQPPDLKYRIQSFMLRPIAKYVIRNSDVSFSYGGKITSDLLKLGVLEEKIIEVPTGIDKNWLSTESLTQVNRGDKLKFAFVGRFDRVKGLPEIYAAIELLPLSTKNIFEINNVGPIPENKQIMSNQVNFIGPISSEYEMKTFLLKQDVLLCTSWSEGMPNVIIEAMASGCAIIATDTGAIAELVGPDNGVLIATPNPELIKQEILLILGLHPAKLVQMKESSILKVEQKFLWNSIAVKLKNELERVVNLD